MKKPITSEDYQRIHDVVNSVIIWGMGHGKIERTALYGCSYLFNTIGAYLLETHYNIEAIPFIGLATFCVAEELPQSNPHRLFNLAFTQDSGNLTQETLTAENGRYCWVEIDGGWIIDFMAPHFKKRVADIKDKDLPPLTEVQSKEFIRHVSEMTPLKEFNKPGDFFFVSDNTQSLQWAIDMMHSIPAIEDMADIAEKWFCKPPKEIPEQITVFNEGKDKSIVKYQHNPIVGSW